MEEDAMDPGADPGGAGAPPICFGAADDDALRRILLFFLDIYRNTTTNTIITIDYLSLGFI